MFLISSRPALKLLASAICLFPFSPAFSAEGVKEAQVVASPEMTARSVLRTEVRIRRMHEKLAITAAQESLWIPVAQVMRENETALDKALMKTSTEQSATTAVSDLRTFQIIADQHAAGLNKFLPVFETLYTSLPPAQQKRADKIFSERHRF